MKALASALLALSCAAYASPGDDGCVGNCSGNGTPTSSTSSSMSYSNASVYSTSEAKSDTRVGVVSGQAVSVGPVKAEGGAGGAASATAGGGAGGNATAAGGSAAGGTASASAGAATASAGSSSVTLNSQASRAAYAPDILATPTAPCRVALGASVGWLGGALGFGTSVLDEGCHIRETARVLAGLGLIVAAVRALCQDPVASKALGEVCKE